MGRKGKKRYDAMPSNEDTRLSYNLKYKSKRAQRRANAKVDSIIAALDEAIKNEK